MKEDPDSILAVFEAALPLPAGERTAYLERVCGNDPELKSRVKSLLSAHAEADRFMLELPEVLPIRSADPIGEAPGDRIGRYKLLQRIGEGGCGTVFMAEQDEPVRRRVALKLIKPGMDTRSVIARFEAERQALALMDHPNIAKVFDAGATESGRPYFIMELIRGIKITDYCDQHALSTPERLELFVQVCQAVQHAHQKGIIHRDLKPSNILVTRTEQGLAQPVVIDFGIAKATTHQPLTDKTLFTAFELLIGTPAYMSPEQAMLTNAGVDTRTDIYSLGVLLYELLTGSTPFDASRLRQAGIDEIRRVIREEEPERPSTRLSTMAVLDLTTVAQQRRSEVPHLIRAVRGDMDWIVMRALEKDRTRRYETANGLALDVRRFLENEPVSACPPGQLYKLRKTIQRHKPLFAGLGVLAVVLVGSLTTVLVSLTKERKARQAAQTEQERSRQAIQFFKNMLAGVGPSAARGRNTEMLREILDKTAQEIGPGMGIQPTVEAEMRGLIGRLYLEIGNYAGAESMARAALELQQKLHGPGSPETAAALNDLGGALWKQRRLAESEAAYGEALAIRRSHFGNQNAEVATTLNNLGAVYRRQKKLAGAETLTRESLAIRRGLFGPEHADVAESLRNLAIVLGDLGQWTEAESCAREMLAMRRRLLGNDHPLVAAALSDLAWVLGSGSGEMEALETEAFAIQQNVLSADHPDLSRSLYLQGERMRKRGELTEAQAVLHAALSMQRKLLGERHSDVGVTRSALASLLQNERKWPEMEQLHREALEGLVKPAGGPDSQTIFETVGLFRALREQNKIKEAEQLLAGILTPPFLDDPACAELLKERVDFMGRLGRWQEAADDAARIIRHRPEDDYSHHLLAPLMLVTHQRPAYDDFCRGILVNFSNPASSDCAERIALACLLVPDPAVDPGAVDKLADTALMSAGSDRKALARYGIVKAMSCYRLGRHREALTRAEQVRDQTPANHNALCYAVMALAHQQLGEKNEARNMLEKGEVLAPAVMPEFVSGKIDESWVAWLISRTILEEAKALIQSPPPASNAEKP